VSTPDPFGDALATRASSAAANDADAFGSALAARAAASDSASPPGVTPVLTQLGHAGMDIAGSVAHAAGSLVDVATEPFGGGGYAQKWSSLFAHEPDVRPPPDQKELARRALPKVDPYNVIPAGPLQDTLRDRVPEAAEAIGTVVPILKGAGGLATTVEKGAVSSSAQDALNQSFARHAPSGGAAAAAPDVTGASMPLQSAIEDATAKGTKPVNRDALARQLKADEFGVQLTKGQATQDGAQLADEFNTRNKNPEFAARRAETNQKLINGINGIKEDVAPAAAVDHETNAQTVIDAYKDKYAPIAADAKAKWEAFQTAAGGALPLEPGDFTAQIGAALKKSGKTRYLPGEVAGDIKDIDDGEPFTVERWDNLKTNLAAAQRAAERTGNGNAALAVSAARDAVENYQFPNLDPKLQAMNAEARAATAQKYAMLRANPAMDAAVNDGVPRGQLSPEAKGYMERYFLKGTQADLAHAQINLAENADAKGAIAGSVLNELKKAAGIDLYRNDGNFSQAGYNTRLNELQPRIRYLMDGENADKAFRLGDVARDSMFQPTGFGFNNSATSVAAQVAKRVSSGVVNAAEHVGNIASGKLKLGTGAREEIENWRDRKWVEDSLKPGAGIDSPQ
jgi:hypothetical protein